MSRTAVRARSFVGAGVGCVSSVRHAALTFRYLGTLPDPSKLYGGIGAGTGTGGTGTETGTGPVRFYIFHFKKSKNGPVPVPVPVELVQLAGLRVHPALAIECIDERWPLALQRALHG